MKILDITLENLNSLRGKWKIDFADTAYTSSGIFAVTGPTGAGKTTIFDAVCLALYGRTPRLAKQKGEIMSKHTRHCSAEVRFEAGGKTYVCNWNMAKKDDGFSTAHTIEEESVSEDRLRKQSGVPALAAAITGLDYKRFTQAALLAQGEFDAFINGSATERAKILELLTGTEIYSEISANIAKRADRENTALSEIRVRRDAIVPRDEFGTDAEISQDMERMRAVLSGLEDEYSRLKSALPWLRGLDGIRDELSRNQAEIIRHEKLIASFAEKRRRLEDGIRAKSILPEYTALAHIRDHHGKTKSRVESLKRQSEDYSSELSVKESGITSLNAELERVTAGLPEGETPESICVKVKSRVKTFIDAYKEGAKVSREKEKALNDRAKAKACTESALKDDRAAREEHEQARSRLSELMDARVSAILEAERRKLKPGVPCPVCGSTEHPAGHYAAGGGSESEILNADGDMKSAAEQEKSALKVSQQASEKLSRAIAQEEKCMAVLDETVKRESDCREKTAEAKSAVSEVIELIGIRNPGSCDEIMRRAEEWKSHADNLNERITALKQEIISLRGKIEENSKTQLEDTSALEAVSSELGRREEAFRELLRANNFVNEEHFLSAKLTDEEMTKLHEDARNYDDELSRLHAVREDRTKRLREEEEKAVTDMKLDEAELLYARREDEIAALRKKLFTLEAALETRRKLKAERDKVDEEYRRQERICNEWSAFNKELGQKNGGKFGKFAQKITLRMLVQEANLQLGKMNSRYTLTMSGADEELSLSVIDHDQANEIRPTDNLSGGERFIISLALALGLSQISGSKAQVDSLFIDEGFGSLDEDALNAALEALGEIRREGRMIGIISHVQGISERIRTKINVIPKSEGTSIITGPGCSGSR
ncbi:MAG: AAA family ATPase [Synergistaceae bacterium]|nr:AAA family ATPase [Synergistaceae bacterium]MBQ7169076.1 AAA family ATPase [Synergistaceae bacterium]